MLVCSDSNLFEENLSVLDGNINFIIFLHSLKVVANILFFSPAVYLYKQILALTPQLLIEISV